MVAAAEADMLLADALVKWRTHAGDAEAAGLSPFDAEGTEEAMAPLRTLAAREDLPVTLPRGIVDLVGEHGREMRALRALARWRREADGIESRRAGLVAEAAREGLAVVELPDWKAWRDDTLTAADRGRALAGDPDIAVRLDRNAALRSGIDATIEGWETARAADIAADRLLREWKTHVGAVRPHPIRPSRAEGHDELVARMEDMAESADLDPATAARLPALVRENERREREQVRENAVSHYGRILDRAGGRPEMLPYQYDHDEFRATLREAREVLGPDFEGVPADLENRLDAADRRIARLKTLADEALELSGKAVRLQGAHEWPRSRTPAHERHGFGAWRARADRFLAAWEAVERDPAMAPHLDRSFPSRDSFELTAKHFRQAELQAPESLRKRQAAERLRQSRDRSEGGGITP